MRCTKKQMFSNNKRRIVDAVDVVERRRKEKRATVRERRK
jgi:hypothetical protein